MVWNGQELELIIIGIGPAKDYCLSLLSVSFVDRRMTSHLRAWDKDYLKRGRVWGGSIKDLPLLAAGSEVLELGCGDGKTLAAMPGNWSVAALDVSPRALQLARRSRADASFILADAGCLPLRPERFDAVFAFHVTGHLLAEQRTLLAREVARVLLPGGKLFFRDFACDDLRAGQGEMVEPGSFLRKNGILTHFFLVDEVAELFGCLMLQAISTHRWMLRVRGDEMQRSEVQAVFIKNNDQQLY
jgi:ubiquinone/menaquinone biosynthesis C-methylase UbiE